ncbi:MAG: S8 family serine peptidase [Burkholderiaceae bacterium]
MKLPTAVTRDEARDLARRLMRDPAVVHATPDIRLRPTQTQDPLNESQWALTTPAAVGTNRGGINVYPFWNSTRGRTAGGESMVVAVIDTGRTGHDDLNNRWLGGYDFVSGERGGYRAANDGDGRDADPSDPGDACDAGTSVGESSWHGTSVAGIIAATADNDIGVAGAAPEARVMPVRALGRCGGRLSDALDAMLWAAGLAVPGIPDNPNPAKVLNLSLGAGYDEPCSSDTSTAVQDAIDAIVARNVLVVAAAGNDGNTPGYPGASGALGMPANCQGVLAVAAHTMGGDLANYSSYGALVKLTAPGGGCGRNGADCGPPVPPCTRDDAPCGTHDIFTTGNSGSDTPGAQSYDPHFLGTSAAAPHVSAAAALLFALHPASSPQDVATALASGARAWPDGTFCAGPSGRGLCGSGMLDVQAAARHLLAAPRVTVDPLPANLPGASVQTLVARATSDNFDAATLTWRWQQISGAAGVLVDADKPTARITLPPNRGQVVLELSVADPLAETTRVNVVLDVNNAPQASAVGIVRAAVGSSVVLSLAATDGDGDGIRYALIEGDTDMVVDPQAGTFSWAAKNEGTHPVAVSVTDAYGARGPDLSFAIEVFAAVGTTSANGGAAAASTSGQGGGGSAGWLELALLGVAAAAGSPRWVRGRRRAQAAARR